MRQPHLANGSFHSHSVATNWRAIDYGRTARDLRVTTCENNWMAKHSDGFVRDNKTIKAIAWRPLFLLPSPMPEWTLLLIDWRTGLSSVTDGMVYYLLLADWFIIYYWQIGLLCVVDGLVCYYWRTGLLSVVDGLVYYLLLTDWFINYLTAWVICYCRLGLLYITDGLVSFLLWTDWFIMYYWRIDLYIKAWFIIYYWRLGLFSFIVGLVYYIILTAWFILCYWRLGLL